MIDRVPFFGMKSPGRSPVPRSPRCSCRCHSLDPLSQISDFTFSEDLAIVHGSFARTQEDNTELIAEKVSNMVEVELTAARYGKETGVLYSIASHLKLPKSLQSAFSGLSEKVLITKWVYASFCAALQRFEVSGQVAEYTVRVMIEG